MKAARDFRPATFASRAKWSRVWRVFHRVEELEPWAMDVLVVRWVFDKAEIAGRDAPIGDSSVRALLL